MAQDLDESEEAPPGPPVLAATVILVRPAAPGFDVYMVRRQASAAAFANVYVFPGGTVRADDYRPTGDHELSPTTALRLLTERGGVPPAGPDEAIALFRAAARELLEEAGVLLACDSSGQPVQIGETEATKLLQQRREVQAKRLALADVLAGAGLRLDWPRLHYFSHWITPIHLPRRFDTRFFLAELPPGQTALHCQIETTAGVWVRPDAALARARDGSFPIVFPTARHLERLAQFASVEELLRFARHKLIRTVLPTRGVDPNTESIAPPPEVAACW